MFWHWSSRGGRFRLGNRNLNIKLGFHAEVPLLSQKRSEGGIESTAGCRSGTTPMCSKYTKGIAKRHTVVTIASQKDKRMIRPSQRAKSYEQTNE